MSLGMTDLKPGTKILHKGDPHEVITAAFSRSSMSKGYVTARLRNMLTGAIYEFVFRDRDNIEGVHIEKKQVQFLYKQGDVYSFMDTANYEQFDMKGAQLGMKKDFLQDGATIDMAFYNDAPISIDIPAKVVLKVTETEPGVKNATASDVKKSAILETGYKINVPVFINEGDSVRINTETGEYVERANS
ncbi:MAG: elongation factor P [Patescibacteria group bacterium]